MDTATQTIMPVQVNRASQCNFGKETQGAKITVSTINGTRTYHVKNEMYIELCNAIVRRRNVENIAKIFYKDKDHQHYLHKEIITKLKGEVKRLATKTGSPELYQKDVNSLESISSHEIFSEWKNKAPLFFEVMNTAIGTLCSDNDAKANMLITVGSMCLFAQNPELSRIQTAVALVLDEGGATDETIAILNKYGMSVSARTMQRRRKELVTKHEEMKLTFTKQKENVEMAYKARACMEEAILSGHKGKVTSYTSIAPFYRIEDLPFISEDSSILACKHAYSDISNFYEPVPIYVLDQNNNKLFAHHQKPQTGPFAQIYINGSPNILDVGLQQKLIISCPSFSASCSYEILGDNFDILVDRTVMAKDRQRKSFHWFLLIAKQKQIIFPHLDDSKPKADILELSTDMWLPSKEECETYENNLDFHTTKILVQYLEFLKPFAKNLPGHIEHPFIKETAKKSVLLTADLIDASENSNEGMIRINNRIHTDYIPRTENGEIGDRIVFGGDVLTNERAFTAQQQVINGKNSFARTGGIIHRPEGLHRVMNLVLLIYQLLYRPSTNAGSLYALRNLLNRRNISGADDVIKAFRPHKKFLDDVLHGFVIGASLKHFGMATISESPTLNKLPPQFEKFSGQAQYQWLCKQVRAIREMLMRTTEENTLINDLVAQNQQDRKLDGTKGNDNKYHCQHCNKKYVRKIMLQKHLASKHNEKSQNQQNSPNENDPVIPTLIKLLFLQYDTSDAYRFGDGDRCVQNAKSEFLYLYGMKHTKYRLWLWRMLAYEMAILSPQKAMEYKWNMSVNTKGGVGNSIPNDNFVELQVKNIKQTLSRQGPNKSFETAKLACQTTQAVNAVKEGMMNNSDLHDKSLRKSSVDVSKDVEDIANFLILSGVIDNPLQALNGFEKFNDPVNKIKPQELHAWIKKQQVIANHYMY